MNVHSFGQHRRRPGVRGRRSPPRRARPPRFSTWGAVLRDLVVPLGQGKQRVTLGLNSIEDYVAHSPTSARSPGRFANRIANGRFTLDGVAHKLARKPGEKHTLHGGPDGFGRRVWKLGAGRRVVGDARTRVARRRSGIPRRLARRLRLPIARAGDVARRTHARPAPGRRSSISPSTPISISTARATCATTKWRS